MPQGSVVDLEDFNSPQIHVPANAKSPPKRTQRLLPAPPVAHDDGISTPTAGYTPTPAGATPTYGSGLGSGQVGTVTELFDTPTDTSSPNYIRQELQTNPHEGMMKIIHGTNANNASKSSNPQLPQVTKSPVVLNQNQREQMLHMMSRQTASPSAQSSNRASVPAQTPDSRAQSTPQPPSPSTALASMMPHSIPPSLDQINFERADIEALERLQEEQ